MITVPEFSTAAETSHRDRSELVGGKFVPAPAVSRPKEVWPVSDLFLVGLVVVLAVVAAVTAVRQIEHRRARTRMAEELKTAAAAFQAYMRERGTAPVDANVGVVPPGMASYLAGVHWTSPTPVGGFYRWVNVAAGDPGATTPAAGMIAITAFPRCPPLSLSTADLQEIDRRIDDGNLATGSFRTGFNGWPILWVRAAP